MTVIAASAGETSHIPPNGGGGGFFHQTVISFRDLFIQTCRKLRHEPVKLKYWEANATASTTTACPESAREQKLNLVIHKHTHAPTIQSPSPHMGLKTIGLGSALPRLLPSQLTAPESALTVLPGVTTKKTRANETEPMRDAQFQKDTELQ